MALKVCVNLTDAIAEPDNSTNLFPNREVSIVEAAIECGDLHGRGGEPGLSLPDPIIDGVTGSFCRSLNTSHRESSRGGVKEGQPLLPWLEFT